MSVAPDAPPSAAPPCTRCGNEQTQGPLGWTCPTCLLSAAMMDAPAAPPGARPFGSYEIMDELGRGGMGVVYRAWEAALDRVVAVKLLLGGTFAGGEFQERFRQEARLAARLRHPGIVTVFDSGEEEGQAFYAMELIEGQTLSERLRSGAMAAKHAATLAEKVARAVQHAHSNDVLHRDLKPSNILISEDGEPKVADFGLARSWHENADFTLSVGTLGSPPYMAPEQASGRRQDIGPHTDVYGLGAVLYQCLTGRPPHQGASPEETLVHVREADVVAPRLLNPSLPRDLETVCLKALEKEPARRYQTATALADDLGRFLRGEPVIARPVSAWGRAVRWAKRNSTLAAVLALLGASLVTGIAATSWQWRRALAHARETTEERYISDIFAAGLAYRSGDWPRAREILAVWIPKAGQPDLRGIEWRVLWHRLQMTEAQILDTRRITVTSVEFSPDESELAIVDQEGRIDWRNPLTGEKRTRGDLAKASGTHVVYTAGPEPLIACGPHDDTCDFFSAATGALVWTLPALQVAPAAQAPRIAIGKGVRYHWTPRGGPAEVWDLLTKKRLLEVPGIWRGVALSPDGKRLALTGQEGGLRFVNVDTGAQDDWPTAQPFWEPAFSSDGRRLAASAANQVLVWDLEAPRLPPVVLPHDGAAWKITFFPGEDRLVTCGSDRCIRFWNAADGRLERLLPGHASEVWCAAIAPKSHLLASGSKDCTARLWTLKDNQTAIRYPSEGVGPPVFDLDGNLATFPGSEARWLDPATGAVRKTEPAPQLPHHAPLRYWLDHGRITAEASADGKILLRETATGKQWTVAGPPRTGQFGRYCIAADAARKRFALCAEPDKFVRLIDLETMREERLTGRPETIYYFTGVAFSPDGLLAGADLAGPIQLWNVPDGTWAGACAGHPQESSSVGFSPDGRTLVSIGYSQSVKLWHLATRREFFTLDYPKATSGIAVSADGKWIALSIGTEANEAFELIAAPDGK